MVEYIDGSTIAQLSPPNMKGPIGYALNLPDRLKGSTRSVDWTASHQWSFAPIETSRFPSISLARSAGEMGSIATATFNAANEVAVEAFIEGKLPFVDIVPVVEKVIARDAQNLHGDIRDLADVSAIELNARMMAATYIKELTH